jgi:penicillin-binding protein 1A
VLTDAIERGIDPFSTRYLSAPFRGPPNNPYLIQTDTHAYTGRTRLDEATAQSDNTVFVRLTLDLGAATVADVAHRMGVHSPLRAVDTIGLGVNPVSPLEMASAYATVAAEGMYRPPYAIAAVRFPDGRLDRSWRPSRARRVIPATVADEVTRVLEEVIAHGTGTAANIGRPAAGKTGTAESLADAWFDGYTPALAVAVWVGYPQARVPMTHVHGIQVFGGTFPARIWRTFMLSALRSDAPGVFTQPGSLHWRPWCGRFQFARDYADAKAVRRCTSHAATTRTKAESTTTRTTTTTVRTSTPATTTVRTPPTTTTTPLPPPTTTTAPPPTTTQATTTAPTTTTTTSTTSGG